MDIQAEKKQLIEWLNGVEDVAILNKVKALRTAGDNNHMEHAIYGGKVLSHGDAVKYIRSWREL